MPEPPFIARHEEHLRLLSIFHYGCAGMVALCACFPIFHLILGLLIVINPRSLFGEAKDQPPALFGWFFALFSAAIMMAGWTFAALLAWAGRCLQKRKRYLFCLVMACVVCFFMPFGTVLGIFTIIVLVNPAAKALFEAPAAPARSS
jgi:hypothetical protein